MTYNDRQEILCQKCTDIAINDGAGETARPSTASDGRSSESNSRSGDTENRVSHNIISVIIFSELYLIMVQYLNK